MGETADVVIIGSGIVGSSVAYHLAEQGCTNVLVIEREAHQGKGSTGKSMGGVRAQFSTPVNIQMSRYSIDFFSRFDEVVGHPADYRAHGYLFCATNEEHLEYLKTNRARQLALGVKNVEIVSRDDIARFVPQMRVDDIIGGTFCPTDGFVDPHSVMMGFMLNARERGVRLWLDTAVTGIAVEPNAGSVNAGSANAGSANAGSAGILPAAGSETRPRGKTEPANTGSPVTRRIVGVTTSRGFVSTPIVVNAAGPWAAEVARLAGAELPVEPLRRQLVPTEPFDGLPQRFPMVIDMSTGFHFRREGKGILLAWNDPEETPGFKTEFDPGFVEKILTRAASRVPRLAEAEVNPRRAWAGLYEMTPDHHAIIGAAADVAGLYFVNGFSGHGVMHSPASGRIIADLILHEKSDLIDTAQLNVDRFASGRLLEETAVL
ncbi:MAG TPA: FAD-binding oxidoreductase [Pyrinomonadaceae bacterium]|nr:FAD-binding oxidoreductase [Pyrinomonadaceae bacterium]